jgi:hypothetical protein
MGGYENKCIPADLEKGATVNTKRQDGAETILPSAYYDNVVKARLQDSPWLESLTHFMDPNAKGISHAMIEALGTKFELEPDFFADYLLGTEYYRMGRQFSQPPDRALSFLLEYVRKAPFYTAEFRRPLHMEGYTRKMIDQLRISNTTTPRGVTFIHNNLPDVFGAEKISVYKRKGSKIGEKKMK